MLKAAGASQVARTCTSHLTFRTAAISFKLPLNFPPPPAPPLCQAGLQGAIYAEQASFNCGCGWIW